MRITQHSVFLQDILRQVAKGQLLPAAFQRPYVWGREDVMSLIESILRGYPIGGFLVWSPNGKADLSQVARLRLGPLQAGADAKSISLLLDGQNRLATMAWLARSPDTPVPSDLSGQEQLTWGGSDVLIADLANQCIRYVPAEEADAGMTLPMYAIFDNRIYSPLMRKKWDTDWKSIPEDVFDRGLKWFDRISAAFREARVVVTDMADASAAEAKDAFLHICKVGVPMSESDFEKAVNWAAGPISAVSGS